LIIRNRGIQGVVQIDLLFDRKLATTNSMGKTKPASVIRTPLTAGAVRARVFFGGFRFH
jgi:hypothetical protein